MITKKFFGIAFMAIVLFIGFTSCCSDDDLGSDEEIAANLIGPWETVTHRGWYEAEGERESEDWDYDAEEWVCEFYKEDTGKEIWYGASEKTFSWSVKDKVLTVRADDYTEKSEITKLTSSQLVIEAYDEDGNKYYDKITFKNK
ncbi:MAG: hypothetical protein LUF85_15990 [Bacteroides sp.]|nr:hypothetical protein [Bacteroides sp.]